MYNGEVNVAQEDLNSFLAVAEDLKVKGLTQNASSADSGNSNHTNPSLTVPTPSTARPKSSAATSPATASLKNGSPSVVAPPAAKRFKRESSGVVKVKEEAGTNQQLVITPEISYERNADAVEIDDDEQIDEAGYEADDQEAYQTYGNYEGEGDSIVDPSTMAVAGTSGVDGNKGRWQSNPMLRLEIYPLKRALKKKAVKNPISPLAKLHCACKI